jgi:hypothetical protein
MVNDDMGTNIATWKLIFGKKSPFSVMALEIKGFKLDTQF